MPKAVSKRQFQKFRHMAERGEITWDEFKKRTQGVKYSKLPVRKRKKRPRQAVDRAIARRIKQLRGKK